MRFKKFSIIISLALVVVRLFAFVAPSAQASFLPGVGGGLLPGSGVLGGLLPYISADLADWIIDNGFDIANYIKSLFDDDVCELSGNGKHDFVQRNLTGSDSGIYYVCQYCGELGSQVFQEVYGTPSTNDSEATGFVNHVQSELGTTVIGPSGLQIPLPATYARDYSGLSGCVPQDNSVYGDFFDIYCVVKDNYSHGIKLYFNADLKAPVSGNYSCVIQFYSSCHSNEFDSWREDNYVSYFGPFQIT